MSATQILEARARAELEMFRLMTVEEGAQYLAWCESQTRRLTDLRERSESYTRLESKAQAAITRRAG